MLDAEAVRGMYEGSDRYVVLVSAKIKIEGRWDYSRKNGKEKVNKVLASDRIDGKDVIDI